jgi:hypothetical protein
LFFWSHALEGGYVVRSARPSRRCGATSIYGVNGSRSRCELVVRHAIRRARFLKSLVENRMDFAKLARSIVLPCAAGDFDCVS